MTCFDDSKRPLTSRSSALEESKNSPRSLTQQEIDQVAAGFGPVGAVAGAIGTGAGVYLTGGNAAQVVAGAIFGGVAGFFGGLGMYGSAVAVTALGAVATGRPRVLRVSIVNH